MSPKNKRLCLSAAAASVAREKMREKRLSDPAMELESSEAAHQPQLKNVLEHPMKYWSNSLKNGLLA